MLNHIENWHALNAAQKREYLEHTEAALITLQRNIPNYPGAVHRPTPAQAWAALTDDRQLALIIELEMQVGNHRDYLNELCRPARPAACAPRRNLQHAAAV